MSIASLNYEIVANVSEGRDARCIARLSAAIRETPGVQLLDVHSDADHDRSVFTYAASGDEKSAGAALSDATLRLAVIAVDTIDLRLPAKSGVERGVHPRIGALDVVPIVPIGATATMHGATEIARSIAAALGDIGLSVHCYGAAARSDERRALTTIRNGEFEQLAERQASDAGSPDFGPHAPHPSAGAVAVGARAPMVAWNIELQAPNVNAALSAARAIARSVRASSNGSAAVPGLQALGFALKRRGTAQVSMNLHDARTAAAHGVTLHAIRATIANLARAHGASLGETEIVGLVHEAVLRAGGDPEALEIRGGWERAALERR